MVVVSKDSNEYVYTWFWNSKDTSEGRSGREWNMQSEEKFRPNCDDSRKISKYTIEIFITGFYLFRREDSEIGSTRTQSGGDKSKETKEDGSVDFCLYTNVHFQPVSRKAYLGNF